MAPRPGTGTEVFTFSEVLSALSLALDRVEGQPEGHAVRSCFIGMTLAERLGLEEEARSALFYALLLKDAGCSSNASRISALFDADDLETKREVRIVDWTSLPHAALYAARTVSPEGSLWRKAGRLLSFGVQGQRASRRLSRSAASGAHRSRASWASPRRRRWRSGAWTSTGTARATLMA